MIHDKIDVFESITSNNTKLTNNILLQRNNTLNVIVNEPLVNKTLKLNNKYKRKYFKENPQGSN